MLLFVISSVKKQMLLLIWSLIGDVKGKNVILVDDMIDTGGTLARAANLMMDRGAFSVRAICTHPYFLEMLMIRSKTLN